MHENIRWSSKAEKTYDTTIENLISAWNEEVVKFFINEVDSLLDGLSKFNKLCAKSKIKNIRKCVISKQTSLVYRIKGKTVVLVAFIPNRTNHKY